MMEPSMRQRQRSQIMGAKGQGVAGLGAPDPNLIALQKNNIAAHQAEDDAGQYEQDVSQGVGRAAGLAGDLSQMDQSRKLGVLGATSNIYGNAQRIAASQRPWWQTLLGGVASGASMGLAGRGGD